MSPLDWLSVVFGVAIVGLSLSDIWLTIFHKDDEGVVARTLQRCIWAAIVATTRRVPGVRRTLLALAGPMLVFATIIAWIGLYILGFAFIVWPLLDGYRTEPDLDQQALGFIDALYYSGVTATVLGYGDITPLTTTGKIIAFVESGLGFIILTGVITYLLNILNGSALRNTVALRIHGDTGNTGDGVALIINSARNEDVGDLRLRLDGLVSELRQLEETFHQFPIVDLYYRSRRSTHDSEFMLRSIAEAALAAQLLTIDEHYRRLRPAAEHLKSVVIDLLTIVAHSYLGADTEERLLAPEPEPVDVAAAERVGHRLIAEVGADLSSATAKQERLSHEMAYRLRVFMDALDGATAWRLDDWREVEPSGVLQR